MIENINMKIFNCLALASLGGGIIIMFLSYIITGHTDCTMYSHRLERHEEESNERAKRVLFREFVPDEVKERMSYILDN